MQAAIETAPSTAVAVMPALQTAIRVALAGRTHFAPSTLSTAASGHRLPSLQVTLAYVKACRGDEEIWHQRWVETHQSITKQEALARSEATAENHGRRTPLTAREEISKAGHRMFQNRSFSDDFWSPDPGMVRFPQRTLNAMSVGFARESVS